MHIYLLLCLLITHVFIDFTAGSVNPILKLLGSQYQTADVAMGLVVALLYASLSFSQLLFGYLYDRFRAYWLIPLAVLVSGGCLGCVGLVNSFGLLLVLIIAAGLAIGAFHPGATALAGSLSDKRRPLAIAIFVCAGALGMAASSLFISRLVNVQGLKATAWLFAPILPIFIVALIAFSNYRRFAKAEIAAPDPAYNVRGGVFSRSLMLLFLLATSRNFAIVVCISGMSFLMSEKIADESQALLSTGNALFLLVLAVGFGGLLSGLFHRAESEKPGIIISLLMAGTLLVVFPLLDGIWLLVIIVLAGLAISSTIPLVTAIGQRLVPHSSAVASSILMGLAWGVSGVAAPLAVTSLGPVVGYSLAMPVLIGLGLGVALLAGLALPRVIRPTVDSNLAQA